MPPTDSERHPRATLSDVAAACGVAPSTVSRALSRPDRVNRVTRERIERAARELGYVPSSGRHSASSGRVRTIAALVSDITNPFYFDMIRGAQRQAASGGYALMLLDTEESEEIEYGTLRDLGRSFDGAVLASSRLTDQRLSAIAAEMPIVAVNRQTAGVPGVFIDTPGGMAQAVEHLVSLGHRRIAYVAGPVTSWPNAGRWRALTRAGSRHGVEVIRLGPFSPTRAAGAGAADAVINSAATACIAFNDLIAIGMLSRLRERDVDVPGDLSLVGCDDIFGADFCDPPLTTVTAPIAEAGRSAVAMLLDRLSDPVAAFPRSTTTLPTHLTVRASTGFAPGTERKP